MRATDIPFVVSLTLSILGAGRAVTSFTAAEAAPASLTGQVTSDVEGPIEGVLVSAKAVGGTITVTVVSDSHGTYSFPAGRLNPGEYQLAIRAVGYELKTASPVEVGSKTATANLKLEKTSDLSAQLMNAEWFASIAGTPEHKTGLELRLDLLDKDRCTMCHSFGLVARSKHSAEEWVGVLQRMRNHSEGSSLSHPDDAPYSPRLKQYWGPFNADTDRLVADSQKIAALASYLASINLSSNPHTWKYELRPFPRPRGAETQVIMTEFDLPRPDSSPHDAAVDPDGMIWYLDFGQNFIGRLDPRTGSVREWNVPALKPYPPFAEGGLDVEIDRDGNPWFALMRQMAVMRFDKKTQKMTIWSLPRPATNLHTIVAMIAHTPASNMVWFDERGSGPGAAVKLHGLDLESNWVTTTYQVPSAYGFAPLSNGSLVFFGNITNSAVGELDLKTGKSTLYPTPTPAAYPRRGHTDTHDRVWFGEYWGGKIGMFDPTSKQIREWPLPAPYADPYDAVADRNGDVWAAGMVTDYVFRLNPTTGHITKYLMPTLDTNVRRMDADNNPGRAAGVWIGENHHGKILRVETLDR